MASGSVQPVLGLRGCLPSSLRLYYTHRLYGSSFLELLHRILNMSPKEELLWILWVMTLNSLPLLEVLRRVLHRLPDP